MAILKNEALRNMTDAELEVKMHALKQELLKLRIEAETGRTEKPHLAGQVKKTIARCLTIMRERKSGSK